MNLDVLYLDADMLVLDKPSGLLAVPGKGPEKQDCLAAQVLRELPDALVVHRLDRDTSGVMVMARNLEAQRRLSAAFERRLVSKVYLADVRPGPIDEQGRIDLPLRKDFEHPPRHCVDLEQGKSATTLWRVVERPDDAARLWLQPLTGRSHQLRVHLQASGWPILGDPLYAPPETAAAVDRLRLHAYRLTLPHPTRDAELTFLAPCPWFTPPTESSCWHLASEF